MPFLMCFYDCSDKYVNQLQRIFCYYLNKDIRFGERKKATTAIQKSVSMFLCRRWKGRGREKKNTSDVFKLCFADVSLNHLILLSALLSSLFPHKKSVSWHPWCKPAPNQRLTAELWMLGFHEQSTVLFSFLLKGKGMDNIPFSFLLLLVTSEFTLCMAHTS